ncbi:hypothetical protein AM1_3456 [Acaryochloris marina MBIC11017]|uniref:Uncharacterized protein n=1 Tax=Acaryochloris marina (strain MBIC 11017) TaxID=329726 RepID=B0C152_ACAM1|nr:hypothetical protein AM1_3456 [Acaryochloris marina MBIC11017]
MSAFKTRNCLRLTLAISSPVPLTSEVACYDDRSGESVCIKTL